MNYLKIIILLSFGMILFSNCTNDETASKEDVAKSICDCVQPVLVVNVEIQDLGKAGKIDEMTNLYSKAEKAFEAAVDCSKKQMNDKIDKKELKKALIKTCGIIERMAEDLIGKL